MHLFFYLNVLNTITKLLNDKQRKIIESMKKLDKIIFAIFILVTVVFLWLISPMGQLYLPIDKSQLEDELQFELPNRYEIKGIDKFKNYKVYHLRIDEEFPHIISLVIQPKLPLLIDEVSKTNSTNEPIKAFWISTTFVDEKENGCEQEIENGIPINLCRFEARWPILNNNNLREGQYSLINKADKTVFIFSSAAKDTYNKQHITDLIETIVK